MILDYLSSLFGWLLWGWVAFMWLAMIITMIGSGFESRNATSTYALCGIFGLLIIQVTGVEVPFKMLFGLQQSLGSPPIARRMTRAKQLLQFNLRNFYSFHMQCIGPAWGLGPTMKKMYPRMMCRLVSGFQFLRHRGVKIGRTNRDMNSKLLIPNQLEGGQKIGTKCFESGYQDCYPQIYVVWTYPEGWLNLQRFAGQRPLK